MRLWMMLATVALLTGTGCTHTALEKRTLNQASTLTDLQYLQVLDNLAMFACNPAALPWHMKLTSASIQVTDQGTVSFLDSMVHSKPPIAYTLTSTLTAQRGVVNQWGGCPTVSADNLELLALAYQKALCPQDQDGKIREALYEKIAELAVLYNLVLTKETLDNAISSNKKLEVAKRWLLIRKNEDLHEQLDKVFDQVAKLSRPITDVQVDNYAQRLSNKVTEETRGEARAKLQVQQAQQVLTVQQTRIGVEDQIVSLTREICALPYVPRYPVTGRAEHNPHDIHLAQYKVKMLLDLAEAPQFADPWVCTSSSRSGLPEGACYVGQFCKCGCQCYACVPQTRLATLRDFTLIVLSLAPIETQESPPNLPSGGVTYSPTVGGR
ncbi:MAG TPA: hypothetical protein VE988_17035 [Gemmataceae bacterium]|nr:hypothetical protein [Gemmataceae bacterium]